MIFRGLARSLWPVQRAGFFSRNLWKVGGLGIAAAVLLTSRGASEASPLPQLSARVAAAQSVPCGPLADGIVTWSASNYILPSNDPFGTAPCTAGVIVGPNTTLIIDAAAGPVQISSSGAGLNVAGGTLETANTDATHIVSFQAAPDVASWEGINITASGAKKGNASLSYVSIQGALRSIQISSGATSSPADSHYGLTVRNSGIGFSYFDGIDALDTPISITGLNDGQTGTINNIGSIGISSQFSTNAPALLADALHVDGMTFGSSAPFGVSNCPANQPCYIGNEAIFGKFVSHASQPVSITNSNFYRAGNYGVQLESANQPTLTNNLFACNGLGVPTTGTPCGGSGPVYSAVFLNDATADLAQAPTNTGDITGNHGYGNGLDAIAFNGDVTSHAMTWQNATNVTNVAGDPPTDRHWLGYLLTGDLNMANATLTIPDGSVVKTLGGTINLTNGTLDAKGPNPKTFTSLRDPLGIPSCPSVFAPSCGPAILPGGEWGGINLSGGSKATINKANILYAATGIRIASGATSTVPGVNYGLVVSNSTIGPTFSDGIAATATPISVTNTHFQCAGSGCQPPAARDHGISADFTGSAALGDGLLLAGNTFHGTVNEAIKGVGLGSQKVDIENNSVDRAGTAGIQLVGADRPTLKQNTITSSGTGTPTYPAIYLNGVTRADFSSAITGNAGSGNGLDAIAFHGGTTSLTWRTVANSTSTGPFGYLLDGPVAVNGNLILPQNAYVPSLGSITVTGGALTATGAVVTSLKDSTVNIPTCGSVFDQKVSGACPVARPGDWTGLTLDSGFASSLSGSEIRYAATGIAMGQQGSISGPLTLNGTNLRNMSVDGIATQSSLAVSGGAFSNIGGRAIAVDLTGVAAGATVSISGASIGGTGSEGILARGLAGQVVLIDGTSVDRPRATGISLTAANHLTLTNNTITNTPAGYPAIYLNGFTGPFGAISGNRGAGNGLDALAFHGTVTDDLTWITARKTGVVRPLGYLLDGDLNLAGTLQVGAGDIVKSNGALNVGHLRADNTSNAGQKVFTSLSDDVAGLAVCHPASVLLPGCTGAAAGDWSGINLAGDGALVNSAIRYAATGINVSSGAATTFGSSSYGLLVSRSHIDATKFDAIDSLGTPASVTDSSINGAIHGVQVDFTGGSGTAALRLSGNRFSNTGAEAVVGQALGGHPLWITDNQVQNAATFGVRLVGADQLVLRNNNISGSGGGPSAGAARYPAIWLSGVTADFTRDVRGNVGGANGLDAIVTDGTAVGNVNWITPSNQSSTHALGYLLDGGLTVDGGTLSVPAGGTVQALGGAIKINGGAVHATGATFTSLKDGAVTAIPCPSVFVLVCVPAPGDWGGLMITEDSAGHKGSGTFTGSRIAYAGTGISIDSGPIASGEAANFRLSLSATTIAHASNDGINSTDTPISVDSSTIMSVGAHGIIASFFSPANCTASPAPCSRLNVTNSTISGTGKDGLVANGLAEQPVTISENEISGAGTYGIRLVGADKLNLKKNTVTASGSPGSGLQYPAIYLSAVTGDFNGPIGDNAGQGNGLNALVFHGTANNGLTWITPVSPPITPQTLGYMLDGPLTVNGELHTTGVVKVLTGGITVTGALTSVETTFTSMREASAPLACNTVFVPAACPSRVGSNDYWGGLTLGSAASSFTGGAIRSAAMGITTAGPIAVSKGTFSAISGDGFTLAGSSGSTFSGDTFQSIDGNGVVLNGAPAMFHAEVFSGVGATSGKYAIKSSGADINIDCSSIRGNANGVSFDGHSAITESDVVNNAGTDVSGPATSSANAIWWGTSATVGNVAGGVTTVEPLSSQKPVLTAAPAPGGKVEVTGNNPTAADTPAVRALGIGTMAVTLTFSRRMDATAPPAVKFQGGSSDPVRDLTSTASGSWNTGGSNRVWSSNAYTLNLATATAGLNHLSAEGATSCVPSVVANDNLMVPLPADPSPYAIDFNAAVVPTTLVPLAANGTYGGSVALQATLTTTQDAVGIPSQPVSFRLNTNSPATATTDPGAPSTGIAQIANAPLGNIQAGNYPTGLTVAFGGDATLSPSPASAVAGGTPITAALTVNRAPLTVTADPQTRVYGANNPTLTAQQTGFVNGDTVGPVGLTPLLSLSTTATIASTVGTYPITVAGPATTANYGITYVDSVLTVTQAALTITADSQSRAYGASNPTLTVTPTGLVNGDTLSSIGVTPTLSVSTTATAASPVGTYPITATSSASPTNYAITYVDGVLTVTQAALTITADSQSRAYGASNPTLTVTPTGLVNGDTLSSIGVTPTLSVSTTATAASPVGTYPITVTSAASPTNYAITYVNGVLTINQAGSTTVVSTDVHPSAPGESVVITATITSSVGGLDPNSEGSVDFKDGITNLCTGVPMSGNTATCTTTALVSLGSHTLTADFGPSTNFTASTGTTAQTVVTPAAPTVTAITTPTPAQGPAAGGTTVTVSGTDLASATDVKFGTVSGTITSRSSTQVVAKSPTHGAGAVDVTVTTPGGTSATSSADQYTFVAYSATVLADSPSIYWRLGEATGTTAVDSSSGGVNSGTYSAGVTLGSVGALVGDSDAAVTLNGTTGSIQESSGAGAPTGSAARSVEVWFTTVTTTSQPLFNYGTPGGFGQFSVYVLSGQVQVKDGTDTLSFATAALADGVWHHLVVTYDGTNVILFVDGLTVSSQAPTGSLATLLNASGLQVGTDGSGFFAGSLDEAAIYPSALTATQVAKHYHAGHGD